MKYVYIVVQKSFYEDFNHVDRMVSDCFNEPEVFSSYNRAESSLNSTARYYTRMGWAGEWEEIPTRDIKKPGVCFAQKAYHRDGDGWYVLYIIKSKVNYYDK